MCAKHPLIFAHRGARNLAPENTVPAFERAIKLGADGIEFDCLLTNDLVPVITHNDDLSILTGVHGLIREKTLAELRRLDFGSHFGPAFAFTRIPTLEESLELMSAHDIIAMIEIKSQPRLALQAAKFVGETVRKFKMRGPVIMSSHNPRITYHSSRIHPHLTHSLVVCWPDFFFLAPVFFARLTGSKVICPSFEALKKIPVGRLHRHGFKIHTWTVNEQAEFLKCVELGSDGVITDGVETMLSLREASATKQSP